MGCPSATRRGGIRSPPSRTPSIAIVISTHCQASGWPEVSQRGSLPVVDVHSGEKPAELWPDADLPPLAEIPEHADTPSRMVGEFRFARPAWPCG